MARKRSKNKNKRKKVLNDQDIWRLCLPDPWKGSKLLKPAGACASMRGLGDNPRAVDGLPRQNCRAVRVFSR